MVGFWWALYGPKNVSALDENENKSNSPSEGKATTRSTIVTKLSLKKESGEDNERSSCFKHSRWMHRN